MKTKTVEAVVYLTVVYNDKTGYWERLPEPINEVKFQGRDWDTFFNPNVDTVCLEFFSEDDD